VETRASSPFKAPPSTGMPMTARVVWAAHTPAKWAALPAAMKTLRDARLGGGNEAHDRIRRAVRGHHADITRTSRGPWSGHPTLQMHQWRVEVWANRSCCPCNAGSRLWRSWAWLADKRQAGMDAGKARDRHEATAARHSVRKCRFCFPIARRTRCHPRPCVGAGPSPFGAYFQALRPAKWDGRWRLP